MNKILKILFWTAGLSALSLVLYLRFLEGISRSFGPDEYYHLHYTYLLTTGRIPFRDFMTIYSPLFHYLLFPVFKIIGESFNSLILSRAVIFIINCLSLFFTYLVGTLIFDRSKAFMIVLIAASLPMAIEKSIEVRPDNLMIMFFLAGVYLFYFYIKRGERFFLFLSGIAFSLSIITLIKIIPLVLGFLFSCLVYFFLTKRLFKEIWDLLFFPAGFILGFILFSAYLAYYGILSEGFYSIILLSREVLSTLVFGTELNPLFWFKPNDAVFGTYEGIAWKFNTVIIGFFVLGVIAFLFARKKNLFLSLLFAPVLFSFLSLYFVHRVFLQYLLPFLAVFPFYVVSGMASFDGLKLGKLRLRNIVFLTIILLSAISIWDSWKVKKNWYAQADRNFIEFVLAKTNKDDVFFGGDGEYVFRQDGYISYSNRIFEAPANFRKKLPLLVPMLEERKTKYLLVNTERILSRHPSFYTPDILPLTEWTLANFKPSDYSNIWVRK